MQIYSRMIRLDGVFVRRFCSDEGVERLLDLGLAPGVLVERDVGTEAVGFQILGPTVEVSLGALHLGPENQCLFLR